MSCGGGTGIDLSKIRYPIDANNSLDAGYYTVNSSAIPNIPYAGYGILVVFKASNYIIQLYLYGDGIKQRKSPDIGVSWGDWKSITFT